MTITTKNNTMGPNKLTAFNRVKLIAMHDAGVRKSVIARDLDVDPMTVAYHINRQKELTDKYSTSTDDAPTMSSTMTSQTTPDHKVTGYLVGNKFYLDLQAVKDVVQIGDTVQTVNVTSTKVVGLVESKEG
tara:strand:- start:73 stop:465 length:393 start_codon:yes stop_codon:yes gene_type:complete